MLKTSHTPPSCLPKSIGQGPPAGKLRKPVWSQCTAALSPLCARESGQEGKPRLRVAGPAHGGRARSPEEGGGRKLPGLCRIGTDTFFLLSGLGKPSILASFLFGKRASPFPLPFISPLPSPPLPFPLLFFLSFPFSQPQPIKPQPGRSHLLSVPERPRLSSRCG